MADADALRDAGVPAIPVTPGSTPSPDAAPPTAPDGSVMTLIDHLGELRTRLFRSIFAVAITSTIGFLFVATPIRNTLINLLPLKPNGEHATVQTLGLGDAFVIQLKISIVFGIIVAMPILLYQLWAFIAPGLTPSEKKTARPWIPLALLFFAITRTSAGKYARDAFLLKVPVLGETIQYALVERFCRVLGSMVSAGVNLTDGLAVTTEAMRNRVYVKRLDEVTEQILEGQGIAGPLTRTGLFPGTATSMLRVGEDTGSLDTQLEVTAGYYETELDYKIAKLTALFEPIVIIVMGLIVGFVAVALVSAMYGIFRQVKV